MVVMLELVHLARLDKISASQTAQRNDVATAVVRAKEKSVRASYEHSSAKALCSSPSPFMEVDPKVGTGDRWTDPPTLFAHLGRVGTRQAVTQFKKLTGSF